MKVPRKALAKSAVGVLLAGLATVPGMTPSSAAGRVGLASPLGPQSAASAVAAEVGLPEQEVAQRLAAKDGLSMTAKAFRAGQGAKAAGVWLDVMRGEVHANVVDDEGEHAAEKAGIIPHRASYTTADLKDVYERLNAVGHKGLMPQDSSWEVDTSADRVVLDLQAGRDAEAVLRAAGVTGADRAKVNVTTHQGAAVARTGLTGGDGLQGDGKRGTCSAGIMLKQAGQTYLMTAGHCWDQGTVIRRDDNWPDQWGNTRIGVVTDRQFPASDYEMIMVDNPRAWHPTGKMIKTDVPNTYNYYNGYVADPQSQMEVNDWVCASGVATGWKCGEFGTADASITTGEGTTEHLIRINKMRSMGGDSGGAVIYGDKAVGTVVGGSTSDFAPYYTYVQPLATVARDYGYTISTVDWAQW
ncbi:MULTISPECIES: S1 family peptidase [unclassified Kitasatospora]|uniref:S1 family peptidase n=1 Tax=unclassified Kitasatospora TaxID=2633591 RepID=UPI0034039DC7